MQYQQRKSSPLL